MCRVHMKSQWLAEDNLRGFQKTTSVRSLISTDSQERLLDIKYVSRKLPFPRCSGPIAFCNSPTTPALSQVQKLPRGEMHGKLGAYALIMAGEGSQECVSKYHQRAGLNSIRNRVLRFDLSVAFPHKGPIHVHNLISLLN